MRPEELERRFVYHKPTGEAREKHEQIRGEVLGFAASINGLLDEAESREISLFFTTLEEASFWLHAHVARNEPH